MSRSFEISINEYYHCYGRGHDKRIIFLDSSDYKRFIALLYVCNSKDKIHLSDYKKTDFDDLFLIEKFETIVDIGAYCLMPNHFHVLLHEKIEGGVSLFMQKLLTGYTMYFNKKYERTGSLFESKFRAEHLISDRYLKYIYSYIHLNPLKLIQKDWKESGIKNTVVAMKYLSSYEYSSYLDYLGITRSQSNILSLENFPEYFSDSESIKNEVYYWINYVKVEP